MRVPYSASCFPTTFENEIRISIFAFCHSEEMLKLQLWSLGLANELGGGGLLSGKRKAF